jgi:hypothetical protein
MAEEIADRLEDWVGLEQGPTPEPLSGAVSSELESCEPNIDEATGEPAEADAILMGSTPVLELTKCTRIFSDKRNHIVPRVT